MLAAPDATAQLVQLGDAEALGVLDEHYGRVGDVDADLDDGRGDEHVGFAGGERGHRLLLLARSHAAVQQHEPVAAQLALAQPLSSAVAARRSPRPLGATAPSASTAGCSSISGQTTKAWRPQLSCSRSSS